MSRLTKKIFNSVEGYAVNNVPNESDGIYYVNHNVIDKLGKLEDILEKYGIDDFEELDVLLGCATKNQEEIIDLSADLGMFQNENIKLTEYIEKYWKLEEELGCPLEVVFKATKCGIEFEHKIINEKLISKYIRVFYSQKKWKIRAYMEIYNIPNNFFDRDLKDYQKTWWLRGERDVKD